MHAKANIPLTIRRPSLVRALLTWYTRNRRDLPWRPAPPENGPVDPYAVLVSEFMLQQTQVATVVPYFSRFLAALPNVAALAASSERNVLRLWQGLGYYSRARNIRAAARKIVACFDGQIPRSVRDLRTLPGIGRYTAGAIASIAFDERAPILDGNVARVLCRLEKVHADPRQPATLRRLWQLAGQILPASHCGQFNSALMELGATICTPRQPSCANCPLRRFCRAAAAGLQQTIPPPRKSRPVPTLARWTICVHCQNRWLLERRPPTGRWAGLWQFPTIETPDAPPTVRSIGPAIGLRIAGLHKIGQIRHALTHRRYVFTAFAATSGRLCLRTRSAAHFPHRRWVRLQDLHRFPLSRPQLRIADMLGASPSIAD
ncbi:MAG: A/G-specific adenine glycosylase [Tepidisphaeraceae bacterium]